jgi:hypothetical protein
MRRNNKTYLVTAEHCFPASSARCGIVVTIDNVEWNYNDGKGPRRGVAGIS